jgi:hypothetical protein
MWLPQLPGGVCMDVLETKGEETVVRLTRAELVTLNNALNEVLHGPEAIPEWEFQTRIGAQSSEARTLLRVLGGALGLGGSGMA